MNKRQTERERLLFKLDHLTETEIADVLTYVTLLESNTLNSNAQSPLFPEAADDEIVNLLGGAYENRRARQVAEWDIIRRRAETQASARHYAQA